MQTGRALIGKGFSRCYLGALLPGIGQTHSKKSTINVQGTAIIRAPNSSTWAGQGSIK
jgi:hypothetical protein